MYSEFCRTSIKKNWYRSFLVLFSVGLLWLESAQPVLAEGYVCQRNVRHCTRSGGHKSCIRSPQVKLVTDLKTLKRKWSCLNVGSGNGTVQVVGPQGEPGPKGDPGTNGKDGVINPLTCYSKVQDLSGNDYVTNTVSCNDPAREHLLTHGYRTTTGWFPYVGELVFDNDSNGIPYNYPTGVSYTAFASPGFGSLTVTIVCCNFR